MVEGTEGQGVSIHMSVTSSPKKLARFIGSEDIFPKALAKLKQTYFCTRPKGGHSATGLSRDLHPDPGFLLLGVKVRIT